MHCLDKDLTAHALFRSYVILILVHMSSGSKIQNQKKSTEPESGQAVLDTSDQLKKMENDLQETRSNITRAPRTDQPSFDFGRLSRNRKNLIVEKLIMFQCFWLSRVNEGRNLPQVCSQLLG